MATPDEGLGASLVLGTSTFDATALIASITPDPMTRGILDPTHLGSVGFMEFLPSDLVDAGGFTIEFWHDGDEQPPITGPKETITIVYPMQPGWITAPMITGQGFFVEYTPGAAVVGELMRGTAKVKWSGAVTFTDHT